MPRHRGAEPRRPGARRAPRAGRPGGAAAEALAAFRARTGWVAPQRVTITKRIPVAGGMGGGSADAAAVLRLAAQAAGGADAAVLHELAVALGADVPSLLDPGRVLMTGA